MRTCCLCKHTSRQCYTFQPHVSQDTFKKKRKTTPLNFTAHISSGLWTLLLWMSASECQRFHASRCCCWISRNLRWREEERLRRPVPEISHEGMFLHVCANNWPWHSRVARGQWQRNAACDCVYLGWRDTAGTVLSWSLRICHAFQSGWGGGGG